MFKVTTFATYLWSAANLFSVSGLWKEAGAGHQEVCEYEARCNETVDGTGGGQIEGTLKNPF